MVLAVVEEGVERLPDRQVLGIGLVQPLHHRGTFLAGHPVRVGPVPVRDLNPAPAVGAGLLVER